MIVYTAFNLYYSINEQNLNNTSMYVLISTNSTVQKYSNTISSWWVNTKYLNVLLHCCTQQQ